VRSRWIGDPDKYQNKQQFQAYGRKSIKNHQADQYQTGAQSVALGRCVHPTKNVRHPNEAGGTDKKEKGTTQKKQDRNYFKGNFKYFSH
jgi:hypothetical protein